MKPIQGDAETFADQVRAQQGGNAKIKRELHAFGGHRNFVWSVNFSPDGRKVLTAGGGARNGEEYVPGNDFGIRVWPLPDSSPMAGRVLKTTGKPEK